MLLEIGNALAGTFRRKAIETIDGFLTSTDVQIVHLTPSLFNKAYALYQQYDDKAWTLVDCVSFVTMLETGVNKALTFDHHFEQAGFELVTLEPDR